MQKRTLRAIEAHAIAEYPRECCGVVVMVKRTETYIPCTNVIPGLADAAQDAFEISDEDMQAAEARGELVAIVHSHPDAPARASQSDLVGCEESALPWVIVSVRRREGEDGEVYADGVVRIDPQGYEAPLIGRTFHHGTLDCYGIVRDFYKRHRGIELPDFTRENGWWKGDQEVYLDNFPKAGFRRLRDNEELQPGDVILMQHYSDRVNHAAVFLDDEFPPEYTGARLRGMMLHHLYGRPSEVVIYGGYWRDITHTRLRFEGLE